MTRDEDSNGELHETWEIEDRAVKCAACAACEAEREHISAGSPRWEEIPELQNPADIIGYPGRVNTDEQHVADTDGVLARYSLAESIQCSLRGRHLHMQGTVVRVLCGKILCMGRDCSKNQ